MSDAAGARPDPVLFPGAAEREATDDALTRTLAAALRDLPAGPVLPDFDRERFRDALAAHDFEAPRALDDLLSWTVEQMRHGLVHVNHPGYFGLFNPAPTFPAECADRIVGAFNPQLATLTSSPAAVAIASSGEPRIAERARTYLDRIPSSSQHSQLRLAGAITARAFATMS